MEKFRYKLAVLLFTLCLVTPAFSVYSQDYRRTGDVTFITGEMVAPTIYREAMEAYNTGNALMRQGNYAEAEPYFLKAIEIDNDFIDAIDHLALVYRHLRRYDESESFYLLSIEKNQSNLVPYINLAMLYRVQGRLEDARQTYLRAQKIDPDDPEPYFGIAVLYQLVGQYETSKGFALIAIEKYREKESLLIGDAFYVQANNFYYLEEFEEALKLYRAALVFNPDREFIKNIIEEIENM